MQEYSIPHQRGSEHNYVFMWMSSLMTVSCGHNISPIARKPVRNPEHFKVPAQIYDNSPTDKCSIANEQLTVSKFSLTANSLTQLLASGAQWLGRVLHWGSKGCYLKTRRRLSHCAVSLSKTFYLLLCTGSTQKNRYGPDMTEFFLTGT